MPEPLADAIRAARDAVTAAELPDDWAVWAFRLTLESLLSRTTPSEPATPAGTSNQTPGTGDGIAKLGLTAGQFSDLAEFDPATQTFKLLLPSSRIPAVKSEASRLVSLLVVSARVAVGLDDDWVDSQYVREALEDYGRYDSSNFTGHLKKFEDEASTMKKDGKLLIKLRRQGIEAAAEVWRALAVEANS